MTQKADILHSSDWPEPNFEILQEPKLKFRFRSKFRPKPEPNRIFGWSLIHRNIPWWTCSKQQKKPKRYPFVQVAVLDSNGNHNARYEHQVCFLEVLFTNLISCHDALKRKTSLSKVNFCIPIFSFAKIWNISYGQQIKKFQGSGSWQGGPWIVRLSKPWKG